LDAARACISGSLLSAIPRSPDIRTKKGAGMAQYLNATPVRKPCAPIYGGARMRKNSRKNFPAH